MGLLAGKGFVTTNYVVILLSLLGAFCDVPAATAQKKERPVYYTARDFKSVLKYDAHIHIETEDVFFVELAEEDNFHLLNIVDDRPFGTPMAELQRLAVSHYRAFPNRLDFATTFSVDHWDDDDWQERTIIGLREAISAGAKAVKIWKNIGLDLKDKDGKFVMVDHPRFDPVFDFLIQNNIPVVGHNGEPMDCWLPLDEMTFSKSYYSAHPEYHMHLHPEYPGYDEQIRARDRMLEKHPGLRFNGAHLGSIEWNLDELAKRLDTFPNMWVDLSRMPYLQLHTKKDRNKVQDFFVKYQDRLLYATDIAVSFSSSSAQLEKRLHDTWIRDWTFYATDEVIQLPGFGELKGLQLPAHIIDKIYFINAQKWLLGK